MGSFKNKMVTEINPLPLSKKRKLRYTMCDKLTVCCLFKLVGFVSVSVLLYELWFEWFGQHKLFLDEPVFYYLIVIEPGAFYISK